MPGCVSQGRTRDDALQSILDAIEGWMMVERERGRAPLEETPALLSAAVAEALDIIDEVRAAGEMPPDRGYELGLATVDLREPAIT